MVTISSIHVSRSEISHITILHCNCVVQSHVEGASSIFSRPLLHVVLPHAPREKKNCAIGGGPLEEVRRLTVSSS